MKNKNEVNTEAVNGTEEGLPVIGYLDSMAGLRRELSTLWRSARKGELDLQVMRSFYYCGNIHKAVLEAETLEARIEKLEKMMEGQSHEI